MKSRDEVGAMFEAEAVALEAITDALHQDRVIRLVQRLDAAGPDFAGLRAVVQQLAQDLPTRRRDDDHIVGLARRIRAEVEALLRPAPVGLNRADIHG